MTEAEPVGPLRTWEEAPAVADELHNLTEVALADSSSVASRRLLGQIFERELDELTTPEGSSVFSEDRRTTAEEDERKREEKHLMAAVARVVADTVKGEGLAVARVIRDGETVGGGGYVLAARDRQGREFEARFGYDMATRLAMSGGTVNLVARIGHAVVRELRAARDNYFKRMELAIVPAVETGANDG